MPTFQQRALIPSQPERFVPTATFRQVEQTFNIAVAGPFAVAIIGAPGVGKTTALTHIAKTGERSALEGPRVAFMTVMPGAKRYNAMLSMICAALGIQTRAKIARELESIVAYRLPDAAKEGWSLIVDEAQLLDHEALFALTHYPELFGLPVVLSGNPATLKRTTATASAIDQVVDRLARRLVIDGVTEADLLSFCAEYGVEDAAARRLVIRHGLKHSIRDTTRLLSAARTFAGEDKQILAGDVEKALAHLHGAAKVVALRKEKAA